MKLTFTKFTILLCLAFLWSCKPNKTFTNNEIVLIPQVQKMALGESSFRFNESTRIYVENVDQEAIAIQFAELFERAAGWELQIIIGNEIDPNHVHFKTETTMKPEAYSLEVSKHHIEIKAAKPAGFFYGIQTLRQLLPIEIESGQKQGNVAWLVPVIKISDSPAFQWRGYMLDVSRHFFPKEDVLRMIDNLALHKINTFHFHLVDDPGWRLEIKKYPKLTSVGAWRVNHEDKPWKPRPRQKPGEKATYGGFYTQDDIREIVAYAQKRFITVVPEIEMPAHSIAALASYPHSCSKRPLTVPSGSSWEDNDIFCAGDDSTFQFLEDVLSEVIDLFPSKYIHIGGDEATKTEWAKCKKCKKRIKAEGLKTVEELQSYFIKRIEKFISSKNRVLMGWDEILEGGLPPKATVMSWRGMRGGTYAATQGHDVVMAPNNPCYLDYYQGMADQEAQASNGFNSLNRVYCFNPVTEKLDAEVAKHILGGQACLWTEYVSDFKNVEYMTFPRIAALSEVFWSPKEVQNWEDFSRRVQLFMKRYDVMGINYSKSAYMVSAKSEIDPDRKQLAVRLTCELPDVEIHYTIDSSEPNLMSPKYTEPILLERTSTLKAVTILNGNPAGKVMVKLFNINKATVKPVEYLIPCRGSDKGSGKLTLVNGLRGSTHHSDGEWQGWQGDNMDVVINLQQSTEIRNISVGTFQSDESIYFPSKVEFFVSSDGVKFQKVAETVNDVAPISSIKQLKDFAARFEPVMARFVRVVAHNIGKIPKGQQDEGEAAWLFVDEIAVE